jgi:hypothetical protein
VQITSLSARNPNAFSYRIRPCISSISLDHTVYLVGNWSTCCKFGKHRLSPVIGGDVDPDLNLMWRSGGMALDRTIFLSNHSPPFELPSYVQYGLALFPVLHGRSHAFPMVDPFLCLHLA